MQIIFCFFLVPVVLAKEEYLKDLDSNWDRLAPRTFCYEGFFPVGKLPWISKRVRDYYFGKASITNSSLEFLTTLYTDTLFLLPVMWAAGNMAQNGITVFPYVFSYLSDWSLRDGLGLPDIPGKIKYENKIN